jgi:hypothetical protein
VRGNSERGESHVGAVKVNCQGAGSMLELRKYKGVSDMINGIHEVKKRDCQMITLARVLILFGIVMTWTGCVTVDQEMTLKEDGSGSSTLNVCVDQKAYRDENYRTEYEALIRQVFDDLEKSPGTTAHYRDEKDYNDNHCYEASHEFGNVNQFGGKSIKFSYGTEDNHKVLRSTILVWDDVTQDQWARFREEETADKGRLSFQFTFPYPITEAIGGSISGMTAVWDFPLRQIADSPMRGMGMTAKAPVKRLSIEGTYKIEGGKSNIRLK